jgi:O-antigen ligase
MVLNFDKFYLKITYFFLLLLPLSLVLSRAVADFIVVFVAIFFIFNLKNNYKLLKNKICLFFFLLYSWLCLVTFLESKLDINFLKSVAYIRFLFFLLGSYIIFLDKKKLNNFLLFLFLSVIFVEIDLLIQFLNGKNIFGFKQEGVRISGVFGNELIAGSFINKFLPLCAFILIALIKNSKIRNYIVVFYIYFSILIIFVTGDRAPFFMSVLCLIFYILYFKNIKKLFLIGLVGLFISIIILISLNKNYYKRYVKQNMIQIFHAYEKKNYDINSNHYFRLWYTAFDDFLDKPIQGNGLNYEKKTCGTLEIENPNFVLGLNVKKTKCVHPHNYYLNILSSTGIVGFVLFLLFIKNIFRKFDFLNFNKNHNFVTIGSVISIFNFLWPLQTTGAFFNNFNSIIFYIILSVFVVSEKRF